MTSLDRWEPKLRVRASNMDGSGYRIPTRVQEDGKPLLVPGVTTVLKVLDKPGVLRWSIDQVVAYAVTHIDDLLNRTEEQGYNFLRFYPSRYKESDFDDPLKDVRDAHIGVLNDLGELGSLTHAYVSDIVNGYEPDEMVRDEQIQMLLAFGEWWDEHEVEIIETEVTVVGNGYAGTLDHLWIIDGVPTLVDLKTSRATRDEHFAQLGALGAAESMMVETHEFDPDGVEYEAKDWGKTYWREEPVPAFTQYAILHLRPNDDDGPAFCELKVVPHSMVDAGFDLFKGALSACQARLKMKQAKKEEGWK